ncbi:MAG: hypothetical protein K2P93_06390 [Alphaproteobacteria bacterium]|nr:hypothetical protein [Alphaproteobacteria bacterium]
MLKKYIQVIGLVSTTLFPTAILACSCIWNDSLCPCIHINVNTVMITVTRLAIEAVMA